MRFPQSPPKIQTLLSCLKSPDRLLELLTLNRSSSQTGKYLHWDKLRRLKVPEGLTHQEWWLSLKLARREQLKPIGLKDSQGHPFVFSIQEKVLEALHHMDLDMGGQIGMPEPITNPQTRDHYLIRSIMEEAITSSQLEGAVTTRKVAQEMIRSGRKPQDTSEQMILNNFQTMQKIREWKTLQLTPELVLQIHALVTKETLEDPTAAGRFRTSQEKRAVADDTGEVFHVPPPAETLANRMVEMCAFANGESPASFVHPVVRAILLHFWLAYDHPFVDGNGRTARALFYWALLHYKYWLFEFVSISHILRKAPAKYSRSFLYTETDDNDCTYFLMAQLQVIQQAIEELHSYLERKTGELRQVEASLREQVELNYRQLEVIRHALKRPGYRYTIVGHQKSHNVVYQTARTDLLELAKKGLLIQRKKGRQLGFIAPQDLSARLPKLGKKGGA